MNFKNELKQETLFNNGYSDAWQFYINVMKNLDTAKYCKEIISKLINIVEELNNEQRIEMGKSIKEKRTYGFCNDYLNFNVKILDVDTDIFFLLDKYLKDFIQYNRNSFDSLAQLINKTVLALKPMNIERVDFSRIMGQIDNSSNIYSKLKDIKESNEYKYLTEFNNKIKHISDAKLVLKFSLFETGIISEVGSFKKRGEDFQELDIKALIINLEKFIENTIDEVIGLLNTYINNILGVYRYHNVKFSAQIIKGDPNNSFIDIYINSEDISTMPNEIEFLFCREENGEFESINFPYNEVFIKNAEGLFLGKYIANELYEERNDIKMYRKFTKKIFSDKKPFVLNTERIHEVKNILPAYMSGSYIKA